MKYGDLSGLRHRFLWRIILITFILIALGSLVYLFFSGTVAKNLAQSLKDSIGFDLSAVINACATFFQTNWMVLSFILVLAVLLVFLVYRSVSKGLYQSFRDVETGIDVLIEGDPLEPVRLSPEMFFLEKKLDDLKQTLLIREKAAHQTEQRKNRLVNNLAQEIKSSLSTLTKGQGLFGDESLMSLDQKSKYTGYSQEKVHELNDLINNFLEFTCNEDITLPRKVIDVNQMFSEIIEQFQPILTAQKKDAVLNVEEKSMIFGNKERIYSSFSTVLKHAVACSEIASAIFIEVLVKEYQTRVRITSRGKNIPSDVLRVMANNFYGHEDADTQVVLDKNGLALVIAQEMLTLHGGSLIAESEDGITTFTIKLPLPVEYNSSSTEDVRGVPEQASYAMGNGVGNVEDYGQDNLGYPAMGQAPLLGRDSENAQKENAFGISQPGGLVYGDESAVKSDPLYSQGQDKDPGFVSRSTDYPQGDSLNLESSMSGYLKDYAGSSVPQGSEYSKEHAYRPQDTRMMDLPPQEGGASHHSSTYGSPHEQRGLYGEGYAGTKAETVGDNGSFEAGYPQGQNTSSLGYQSGYLREGNLGSGSYQMGGPGSQEKKHEIGVPIFGEHGNTQGLSLYENQYEEGRVKDKGKRKDKDKSKAKQRSKDKTKNDGAEVSSYGKQYLQDDNALGSHQQDDVDQIGYSQGSDGFGLSEYPQGESGFGAARQPDYPQADGGIGTYQQGYPQGKSGFGIHPQNDSNLGNRQLDYSQNDSDFGARQSKYLENDGGFGGFGARQSEYLQNDSSFGTRQSEYPQNDSGFGARQSEYLQKDSSFGAHQSDYPQNDSGFGARQSEYLQKDSSFGARQSDYLQKDSSFEIRQSEYPQKDSGFGARQLEYLQNDSSFGARQSEYPQADGGNQSRYPQSNSELIPSRQSESSRVNIEEPMHQGQEYARRGGLNNTSAFLRDEKREHRQSDISGGETSYDKNAPSGELVPYSEIAPSGDVQARSNFYNSIHHDQSVQMKNLSETKDYLHSSVRASEGDSASRSQADSYNFLASKEGTQLNKTETWSSGDAHGIPKYFHKRGYAPDGAYESFPIKRGHESIHKNSENGR